MDEEQQQTPIARLRAALAGLNDAPEAEARAGHHDLAEGLWLSTDPAGRAILRLQGRGAAGGFSLVLEGGDSGAWAALGLRLAGGVPEGARYLGLMVEAASPTTATLTPRLRTPAGDRPATEALVLMPAPRTRLIWFPLEAENTGADLEINLFFSDDAAEVQILRIDPVVMI